MIFEEVGIGNSIQEAYEDAKRRLNAPEDADLHQETLQFFKKKLFGLKTEPAKVRVWYEVPDKKPEPARPAKPPRQPEARKPAEKPHKAEKPAESKPAPEKSAKQPAEQKKPAEKAPKKKPEPKKAAPEPANLTMTPVETDENDAAVKFLRLIAEGMQIEHCDITLAKAEETGEYVYTVSCGEEDGALIGRRGEMLDAIQYLLRLTENKGIEENRHRKISVNIGNYREKRNASLRSLAQSKARQVLKYGKNAVLDPMSPYERRIIHTTIQGIEGVTSHSVGSDANRKVVITLEEGVVPTNPRPERNDRGDRGGRGGRQGGRGGRGGFQKREPYKPAVTREPRKDSEGSLYGKIEVPAQPAQPAQPAEATAEAAVEKTEE